MKSFRLRWMAPIEDKKKGKRPGHYDHVQPKAMDAPARTCDLTQVKKCKYSREDQSKCHWKTHKHIKISLLNITKVYKHTLTSTERKS